MLVFTRRVGETFMIGDEVTITILGKKGNQTRFGVKAPKEISVHREEIYWEIKAQNAKNNALKAAQRTLDPTRMCLQQRLSTGAVVLPNHPQGSLPDTSPAETLVGKPPTVFGSQALKERAALVINCLSESGSQGVKVSR